MKLTVILALAAFGFYGIANSSSNAKNANSKDFSEWIKVLTTSPPESKPLELAPNDTIYPNASYVDFDRFLELAQEVREHRAARMVSLEDFNKMALEENTIILDTRSKAMYEAKHIKGAVHLNFSDFTKTNLARLIPDTNTRILIYCNNNILNDEIFFATKSVSPIEREMSILNSLPNGPKEFPLTMALNVPTYINLYGYGYKNVFELADLVSVFNADLKYEGSEVYSAINED